MALAMVVLMTCAALAGVMVTRNLSEARASVRAEHRTQALALAQVGVVDAESRILDGQRSFDSSGDLGDRGSWTSRARQIDKAAPNVIEVTSVARVGGERRAVAVTVEVDRRSIKRKDWSEVSG